MHNSNKGIYSLQGDFPFRTVIHLTPTTFTLGIFQTSLDKAPRATFAEIRDEILESPDKNRASGRVFSLFKGEPCSGLPDTLDGELWEYCGAVTFDINGHQGSDEIVDFSTIIFNATSEGKLSSWSNRLVGSRIDKNESGTRHRSMNNLYSLGYIWMPVNTGNLGDTRITIPHGPAPVILLGSTPTPIALDPTVFLSDVRKYTDYFWTVDSPVGLQVPAGGSIDVPLQLVENMDGSPLTYSTKVTLEEISGYCPHKRVTTDAAGAATVTVHALGLVAGEQINVKINAEHYSVVGRIIVDVI